DPHLQIGQPAGTRRPQDGRVGSVRPGRVAAASLERARPVGGGETGRPARARAAELAHDVVQRRVPSSRTPFSERNATGPYLDTAASGGVEAGAGFPLFWG